MCLCVLRNDRALRARLPYAAPDCSQFLVVLHFFKIINLD